jgi:hypothetical protein
MAVSLTKRSWCVVEFATLVTRPDSVISSCGVSSRTMFTSHHFQRHNQNCESASTPQSGTSHKTCLRGFGGNGCIAWTYAVSHVGRTSNAFKVTIKLQTFLFQMAVTSCISVQYVWKYGFAKYSHNLYAPCISGNYKQRVSRLNGASILDLHKHKGTSIECDRKINTWALHIAKENSFPAVPTREGAKYEFYFAPDSSKGEGS